MFQFSSNVQNDWWTAHYWTNLWLSLEWCALQNARMVITLHCWRKETSSVISPCSSLSLSSVSLAMCHWMAWFEVICLKTIQAIHITVINPKKHLNFVWCHFVHRCFQKIKGSKAENLETWMYSPLHGRKCEWMHERENESFRNITAEER